MQNKKLGLIALISTSLLFGSYGLWTRLINNSFTAFQQIALRYGIASIIVFLILIIKKEKINFKKFLSIKSILFFISMPLSFVLFILALIATKLSVATVGFYLGTIVLSTFFGIYIFKEKLTKINGVSLVCGIIGLLFILFPFKLNLLNWGFISGITSGILYGSANAFKKYLKGKISRLWMIELIAISTVAVLIPFIIFDNKPIIIPSNIGILFYLFIFALVGLISELLTVIGFQNFDLNIGSIILSGEIVVAGIIGYILFHEVLLLQEFMGIIFISIAIVIPNISFLLKTKK